MEVVQVFIKQVLVVVLQVVHKVMVQELQHILQMEYQVRAVEVDKLMVLME